LITNAILNDSSLEITDAGSTKIVDLSSLIDDADSDPANELITNAILNDSSLEITDAGSTKVVDLSSLVDDGDWTITGNDIYNTNSGKVGIGNSTPDSKLHVQAGVAGNVTAHPNSLVTLENNNSAYINFLTPELAESGILFGTATDNSKGGIIYNDSDNLEFRTNGNQTRMELNSTGDLFLNSGNIGLGVPNPTSRLHFNNVAEKKICLFESSSSFYGLGISDSQMNYHVSSSAADHVFYTGGTNGNGTELLRMKGDGTVGIGTTTIPTGYKLAVDGNIICEKVRVQSSGAWPDYVFKKDYSLKTLEEVAESIDENGHLPDIPSAAVIDKEGIELADMSKRQMEKIEELMLYAIQANERIKELEKQVKALVKDQGN
ncbi:MAG: hypothetical protein ACI86M_001413, partial [Saprospiraceae bacterium]